MTGLDEAPDRDPGASRLDEQDEPVAIGMSAQRSLVRMNALRLGLPGWNDDIESAIHHLNNIGEPRTQDPDPRKADTIR